MPGWLQALIQRKGNIFDTLLYDRDRLAAGTDRIAICLCSDTGECAQARRTCGAF